MRSWIPGLICVVLASFMQARAQEECSNLTQISTFSHDEIGDIKIYKDSRADASLIMFKSQMHVNTDGAPDSYHPDNIGVTHICNGISIGSNCTWTPDCLEEFNKAKSEGFVGPTKVCFFAMVTDSNGVPIIQKEGDPKPGYYISTTALQQPGFPKDTPQAQLDSNEVPFIVIPSHWQRERFQGVQLGDFAAVFRKSNGEFSYAVVGDLGPRRKLGEGSIHVHKALGNDPFVERPDGNIRAYRGIAQDVVYVIFPGTSKPNEFKNSDLITQEGKELLEHFGGEEYLRKCADKF